METAEATNQLLKNKYNLHTSEEAKRAAKKTMLRSGEKVPQDPLVRIQNYLDRLGKIINPQPLRGYPNFNRQERNIEILKSRLYDKFVVRPEEISESYWENQRRIIRERGQGGDLQQVVWQDLQRQNTEAIITDQKSSLNKWIDYFITPDSSWIPNALKYYTLRSILNMGEYDKDKKVYPQRSKGTTKPFPDLNREALAYVLDALNKKYQGRQTNLSSLRPEEQQQFEKLLQGENFGKMYAWAIEKVTPADEQGLVNTAGQWVKYDQGSDHMPLVISLQGYGTGWCTAGESTAQTQLQGGDFYVYYSNDRDVKPTVPRVAIRMEGSGIAEVRGIAPEQNLDPYVVSIVEQKLEGFSDGKAYQKKVSDMKRLTEIDRKIQRGELLNATDLTFLYEINSPIQGFGYSRDPRIKELRNQRNPEKDTPIVFGCEPSQIAHSLGKLRSDTKAYVGPLVPGIFDKLQEHNVEHVYTSFPEGKITFPEIWIGGVTKGRLQQEVKKPGFLSSQGANKMMENPDFTTLSKIQKVRLVKLKVSQLGLSGYPTTDQIYKKAQELGLDLCPAEVGPQYRLQYADQPLGEWFSIVMKQIADSYGNPHVFFLDRDEDGLWLHDRWADPGSLWSSHNEFVFSLRKSKL